MKYLLDTCIIVSALRSKQGASHFLLYKAILQELPIIMHFKLLAEYRDVLTRPEMALEFKLHRCRNRNHLNRLAQSRRRSESAFFMAAKPKR